MIPSVYIIINFLSVFHVIFLNINIMIDKYNIFDATITVDTNGDKDPNCFYNATSCKKPDMFEIIVGADGKVSVDGDLEKEYLKDTSVIRTQK